MMAFSKLSWKVNRTNPDIENSTHYCPALTSVRKHASAQLDSEGGQVQCIYRWLE